MIRHRIGMERARLLEIVSDMRRDATALRRFVLDVAKAGGPAAYRREVGAQARAGMVELVERAYRERDTATDQIRELCELLGLTGPQGGIPSDLKARAIALRAHLPAAPTRPAERPPMAGVGSPPRFPARHRGARSWDRRIVGSSCPESPIIVTARTRMCPYCSALPGRPCLSRSGMELAGVHSDRTEGA